MVLACICIITLTVSPVGALGFNAPLILRSNGNEAIHPCQISSETDEVRGSNLQTWKTIAAALTYSMTSWTHDSGVVGLIATKVVVLF